MALRIMLRNGGRSLTRCREHNYRIYANRTDAVSSGHLASMYSIIDTAVVSRGFSSEGGRSEFGETEEPSTSPIVYEGPFADTSLRLKRVSVTTAALGVFGMPLLIAMHGGDVPAAGQAAVGGTACFVAIGSTLAMSFCFTPYVHKLEWISPPIKSHTDGSSEESSSAADPILLKATTRNIIAMKVETIFDPAKDIMPAPGSRPFCNMVAKGMPMFVHPELIFDETLRTQLLGETKDEDEATKAANKKLDDDFL
eukprot:scaffold6581_cov57-Attheya_sp.AAC.15